MEAGTVVSDPNTFTHAGATSTPVPLTQEKEKRWQSVSECGGRAALRSLLASRPLLEGKADTFCKMPTQVG